MIEELELAIMANAIIITFVFFKIYQYVVKRQQEQAQQEIKEKLEQQKIAEVAIERLRIERAKEKANHKIKTHPSEVFHKNLPEDCTLRRHYLTHLKSMLETVLFPRPTEFNLRRHYDSMIDAKIKDCLDNKQKMARLVADYEAFRKSHPKPFALHKEKVVQPEVNVTKEDAIHPNLPQDVTLRRHYLTHLKAMLETVLFPRPSEFNLRRHYDSMIDAKIEACLNNEQQMTGLVAEYEAYRKQHQAKITLKSTVESQKAKKQAVIHKNLPQDSTLRRHYLTHLKAMLETVLFPRPTEFNLRRHYDTMIEAKIESCLNDDKQMARLVADYEALKKQAEAKKAKTSEAIIVQSLQLPEDSTLKRHYLTHIKSMLEMTLFPRPTDYNLRRHYDSMIGLKLEECLNCQQKMNKLISEYENIKKKLTYKSYSLSIN